MSRQNIFEILKSKYDIKNEMDKINHLFNLQLVKYTQPTTYNSGNYTIEEYVDNCLLFFWKQRRSYLSCREILDCISESIQDSYEYSETNIITFLEYYVNLINLLEIKNATKNINSLFYREFWMLKENIDILIEHLNYEKFIINEEEKVILIPKNPAATAVAEISSEDTALAILKYNHASLKGDLKEKRNLLNSIYLEYETVLDNPIEGYGDFFNKTKRLYNNLHIRHDNKTKENNKNVVLEIDDEEREKWYDELYQLFLFCVLIKDNLERKKEVEEFLKSIKGAKAL